jgi:hypothetical protein
VVDVRAGAGDDAVNLDWWLYFGLGLLVSPLLTLSGVWVLVLWSERGARAPGSRSARREGCCCPGVRNWFGARETLSGVSVLCVGCPVERHRPDVRRHMYNELG